MNRSPWFGLDDEDESRTTLDDVDLAEIAISGSSIRHGSGTDPDELLDDES